MNGADPHADAPLRWAGEAVEDAELAVVLLHGRGASADDILSLAKPLATPGVAFVAPQAAGHTWYPQSFLAPTDRNRPWLGSAHACVGAVIERLREHLGRRGLGQERIGLIGFSQGACLAVDHAHRSPGRYAFVAAYTGGLIGPPGTAFAPTPGLNATPVFLGASDPDPHVPWDRVAESAGVLERQGALVTAVRYPGQAHTILADQVARTHTLIQEALRPPGRSPAGSGGPR